MTLTVNEMTEQNETEQLDENTTLAEQGQAAEALAGDEHTHDHAHQHGAVMNPELRREIAVEAPAEEVSKSFRTRG